MAEIYSVVAAFGSTADAESAVQKLERSGLHKSVLSIEGRVSPIHNRTTEVQDDSDLGTWAITGAILGGFWGYLLNEVRFRSNNDGVLVIEPFLSCLSFALKGACIFAGVSFISLSVNGEISGKRLMDDGPTLSVDPYLLVVHGTSAAVMLARDVLKAA
jgi:hypothetical protein